MIRAKTCFLAEGVTTDRDTGQVSAFRLIQNLRTAAYPAAVPKIAFFCLWERADADPSRSLPSSRSRSMAGMSRGNPSTSISASS